MRFRKTRSFRRTRRRRWDMQTYRDCDRMLEYFTDNNSSCNSPQIYADLVCGPVSSTDAQMTSAASRGMSFGGGHLQIRYNSAILASTEAPCSHAIKVVSALVKLPLLEDDLTPAYLPNLAIARSQLSVVHATQSDTDEDVLWLWDDQLDLLNVACNTNGGNTTCAFDNTDLVCNFGDNMKSWYAIPAIASFGRMRHEVQIKTKRRLKEREAIFLLTEYVNGGPVSGGDFTLWPIQRNVYFRYAVHP